MKIHATTLLSMLLAPVMLHAQTVTPADQNIDKTPELTEIQKEFSNLPEEKRKDYAKFSNEAMRLFSQKRIFETLDQADQAMKIFDRDADLLNLIGSCYVEFRDFKKAREYYDKALVLAPKSSVILFNIAELEFVTRNWRTCLDKMQAILPMIPAEGIQTKRVVELKILLCHLALGQVEEAKTLANKYDPLQDDTPFYYYAQASLKFQEKDLLKAEEYLQMANRIFVIAAYISPWQDTLIEYGFIPSYYGGEQQEEKPSNGSSPAPQPQPGSGAK
jgi:tetratricopeptide (TPR) repeat protein